MINKETILSNYNDRLTLLQWLKKVELALKNASAKEFRVNQLGNATLTFSIVFDDNTTLTTGPIVLQQGESVASATISGGHLLLTLTNGDVLDAGNTGAVTSFSIDGSQHLIVTYQDGTTQDLGAIFSGNVNIAGNLTADSIIENMAGYSFDKTGRDASITYEDVYAGCVKNGNKLTVVIAVKITPSVAINEFNLGDFIIPEAVGSNLYPTTIAGAYLLSVDDIKCYKTSSLSSPGEIQAYCQKASNTDIRFNSWFNNLVANETYYVRIEKTFLLSANLA